MEIKGLLSPGAINFHGAADAIWRKINHSSSRTDALRANQSAIRHFNARTVRTKNKFLTVELNKPMQTFIFHYFCISNSLVVAEKNARCCATFENFPAPEKNCQKWPVSPKYRYILCSFSQSLHLFTYCNLE